MSFKSSFIIEKYQACVDLCFTHVMKEVPLDLY
jgi:hypothetical protein